MDYKDYQKKIGTDYNYFDKFREFDKFVSSEILSKLIQDYQNLTMAEKTKLTMFIDKLVEIVNKNSLKARVLETLILCEALCKYIATKNNITFKSGKGYSGYQERIKSIIKYYNIPFKEVNFTYSNVITSKGVKLWLITNLRNELAHENIFTSKYVRRECFKVLKFLRRLIFYKFLLNFKQFLFLN